MTEVKPDYYIPVYFPGNLPGTVIENSPPQFEVPHAGWGMVDGDTGLITFYDFGHSGGGVRVATLGAPIDLNGNIGQQFAERLAQTPIGTTQNPHGFGLSVFEVDPSGFQNMQDMRSGLS